MPCPRAHTLVRPLGIYNLISGTQAELQVKGIKEPEALKDIIMKKVNEVSALKPEYNATAIGEKDTNEFFELILAELTRIRKVLEEKSP